MALPLPDDRLTVGKWLVTWFGNQSQWRPGTRATNERAIRTHLLPTFGSISLRRLTVGHVSSLLATMEQSGYSRHTAAGVRNVLSTALRDAMREGYLDRNVASLAKGPRLPSEPRKAPTPETVHAVLEALTGHRLRPLYVLLAGTGLRVSEALGLRWEDLDASIGSFGGTQPGLPARRAPDGGRVSRPDGSGDGAGGRLGGLHQRSEESVGVRGQHPVEVRAVGTLTVRYQLSRQDGEWVLPRPKTRASQRTVALPPAVVEALEAWRTAQKRERLEYGVGQGSVSDLIFTRRNGDPEALSSVQWVLARACKAVGVQHITPHDFRRFYATQVEQRAGREVAQRALGHASPSMTNRYVTTTDTMLRAAADAAGEALG